MQKVQITDLKDSGEIDLTIGSLAVGLKIDQLKTTAMNLVANLDKPVATGGENAFNGANFEATFEKPSIAIKGNTLDVKTDINSSIAVTRSGDTLFGDDDYDPVKVQNGDCWVSFDLSTLIDGTLSAPLPDGFGVSFEASAAPEFATYVRFAGAPTATTTLREALGTTLERFQILGSADDVLAIPPDTIYTSNVQGTVKLGASWAFPFNVSSYTLAQASLPLNESLVVQGPVSVQIAGDLAIASEYNVRIRKSGPNTLSIGLFHKRERKLDVSFSANAGLEATVGNRDLIESFLQALWPKVTDTGLSGVPKDVRSALNQALNDALNRSLALSFETDWSTQRSHEPVFVYQVDISKVDAATKQAIQTALEGDWKGLAQLARTAGSKVKEIENGVIDTIEKKHSTPVNLLGIYNYRTVKDFVISMRTIVPEDGGPMTITDNATATTITTGNTAKNLRKALYESFLATATYQAMVAGAGLYPKFNATQKLVRYNASMGYRDALKELKIGVALGVVPDSVVKQLPQRGAKVKSALFQASRSYTHNDVLRFFFSDIRKLTPRTNDDLTQLGRKVLASLLDAQEMGDQQRIAFLNDDAAWAAVAGNPVNLPGGSAADYLTIVWWAAALAKAAPLVAKAIRYAMGASGNPMLDPTFQNDRKTVIAALAEAGRKSVADFDDGFSICVMSALAGTGMPMATDSSVADFSARWNGSTIFDTAAAEKAMGAADLEVAA